MTADEREDDEWGGLPSPNAGGFAQGVIEHLLSWCPAFDPYSAGQNLLIEFLEALQELPQWQGPETYPDANGDVCTSTFWEFGRDWIGLVDEVSEQVDYVRPCDPDDTAARDRWRNFQHAIARITAHEFIDCAPHSALHYIQSDLLSEQRINPVPKYDIIAAAQWVIYQVPCEYVYRECLKNEIAETGDLWTPWSKDRWCSWKTDFEFVAGSTQYDSEVRQVAARAVLVMKQVEAAKTGES